MGVNAHGRAMRIARLPAVRWLSLGAAVALAIGAVVAAAGRPRVAAAASSASPAVEPARMKLVTALVDDTLKGLLPFTFNLPSSTGPATDGGVAPAFVPATLLGLRYCGVTEQGAGRFRAVIRLAGTPVVGAE